MSTQVIVMPDAEAVAVAFIRAALVAAGEPAPVYPAVPATRPQRFVTVERLGGGRQTVVSDRAMVDVHCWGKTRAEASDLAALVRGLMGAMPGVRSAVTVYSVTDVGAPQWLPDPASSHPRFALAFQIHIRGQVRSVDLSDI